MSKWFRRLSLLSALGGAGVVVLLGTGAPRAQTAGPISPKDAPIVLFNGKDLKMFRTWMRDTRHEDPRRVFNVAKDGDIPVIHITGDGYGGLITNDEFTNYHLIAEYRWGDKTWGDRLNAPRDNGILLHGIGPDGGSVVQVVDGLSPWLASYEFQIEEGTTGDLIILGGDKDGKPLDITATSEVEVREPMTETNNTRVKQHVWKRGGVPLRFGRGTTNGNRVAFVSRDLMMPRTLGNRGANDLDTPGKGWTRVEVLADGNTLTYIVNGTTVMEATGLSVTAGRIQIQTEQAEIFYRRIELLPLKKR
jgi:hypothetical protein